MNVITQADRPPDAAPPVSVAPSMRARRHSLIAQVARNLRRRCGVERGSPIVLAVSGGADSLALLITAAVMRSRRSEAIRPTVVHVDHRLRTDSEGDASHVASICGRFGLPFRLRAIEPAREPGNTCDAARRLRYRALADEARSVGAAAIAVAHHRDDQFETILMNLCRGCGIDGLGGMAWARPMTEIDPSLRLVRPLLNVGRDDCRSLCEAANVAWREDPSNKDLDRTRARLRHEVIPVLESLWPGAARRACRTASSLGALHAVVDARLDEAFGPAAIVRWPRAKLALLPPALLAAGLHRAVRHILEHDAGRDGLTRDHLLQVVDAIGDGSTEPRRFDWPAGMCARITTHEVTLEKTDT